MFLLIVLLPFLGFIYSGLLGKVFGREASGFFSTLLVFLSFLLSVFSFYEVVLSSTVVSLQLFSWTLIDIYSINFGLLFDALSASMLIIVTGISSFVHLYSLGYMSHDPHLSRFMSYLSLFTFFMLVLVTSDNFVQLFIGWEGVGLCSFLLINFWYTRILANKAALKAMIMNRIADVFFVLGIILVFLTFKTTNYSIVFNNIDFILSENISFFNFTISKIDFICFFLLIGGIGKSAQLGLHTWLPDAMEGPTPVSSLLHAATMVTAGVFLLIRCSPIFEYSSNVLLLASIIGALTALFSAIIGVFQYDVKKIIAYSTCSQLGYMFLSCGLSNYQVAIFHLINHAFFKALLFLSAGSIIHALFDEQDMRRMGGFVNFLPFTYFAIFLGSLAIMGFPFLTGFYSKDLVLELVYSRYVIDSSFIHLAGVSAAFFTAVYSIRLLLFVFFLKTNAFRNFFVSHESSLVMSISMFSLIIFSIFWGYLTSDLFAGWGSFAWNNSIFLLPSNSAYQDPEFLKPFIKNLPLIVSFIGMSIGFITIFLFDKLAKTANWSLDNPIFLLWARISAFFYHAGYFNTLYNNLFLALLKASYITTNKYIDKGILELFGPFGFYKVFRSFSLSAKNFTPTIVFFTVGWMFFFLTFFVLFIFLHFSVFSFLLLNPSLILLILIFLLYFNLSQDV